MKDTTTNITEWSPRVLDSGQGRSRWRRRGAAALLIVLGCTTGCACSGVEPESPPVEDGAEVSDRAEPEPEPDANPAMKPSSVPQSTLDAALDDAATRTSVDRAKITVVSAGPVTWPDGSAGCPEPGMMYTQALVPGYRVVLQAGDEVLNYHATRSGAPQFCPAERVMPPSVAGDDAI